MPPSCPHPGVQTWSSRLTLTWLLTISVLLSPLHGQISDEEIGDAIQRIKRYLYTKQDPQTGSWEFTDTTGGLPGDVDQAGGKTALIAYALLVSGDSSQLPQLSKAVGFLQRKQLTIQTGDKAGSYPLALFQGTYAVAVRAHAWAHLPPIYHEHLRADADWLIAAADKHRLGLLGYHPADTARVDHSIMQYGLLGLEHASRHGVDTPKRYWQRWIDHFIASQQEDGGWSYRGSDDHVSTGSMTTAGLTALLLGQQQLHRDRTTPEPELAKALNRGFDWLDQNFDGAVNTNSRHYTYYYLYGIERAAFMSGRRAFNGKDWYQEGATHILRTLSPNGDIDNNAVRTAFSLLFLARGRYPVWINKLRVPGQGWNNCPNDLHQLSRHLSRQREGEVNWQTVGIDTDPEKWLVAPVTFLASSEPVAFTAEMRAALKRYLDLGGMLVTSPDSESEQFIRSVRELAAELYPDYPPRPLPNNHELFHAWGVIPEADRKQIDGVSNGARELIVMSRRDLSHPLQNDLADGRKFAAQLMTNLFAYVTDKGSPNNRLVSPLPAQLIKDIQDRMTVGRPRYTGNWLPEPQAWRALSAHVFNHTGLATRPTPAKSTPKEQRDLTPAQADVLELDQISSSDHRLIHLTGTDKVELTPDQLRAIRDYASRGGTILVETVGGRGDFSQGVHTQLAKFLGMPAVPLTSSDAVISGEGLSSSYDVRRTPYRQFAVIKLNTAPVPELSAFMLEDRPAILLSSNDLSLGALGVRHWNIIGYQPDTCRKMLTNIVLWAHAQPPLKPADGAMAASQPAEPANKPDTTLPTTIPAP